MYQELANNLHKKQAAKKAIVAAGVESPEQIQSCESCGCDLILYYPTAIYENTKNPFLTGYLAFGNTNSLILKAGKDVLPPEKNPLLLAGLNGSDPFKNDRVLLEQIQKYSFGGIHNYPAMALVDGNFGMNLQNLNAGFDREITLFQNAGRMGMFTCAMVRTAGQAIKMARIPVDIMIFYLGLGENDGSPEDWNEVADRDIAKLHLLSGAVRKISVKIPLLFYDERRLPVREIERIIREVEAINGYLTMPAASREISLQQMSDEIKNLLQIAY